MVDEERLRAITVGERRAHDAPTSWCRDSRPSQYAEAKTDVVQMILARAMAGR
jgi:hypothetical protein